MTTTTLPTTEVEGRHLHTRPDGTVQLPCTRCGDGDGHIEFYRHVSGGVCFECDGLGGPWVTPAEATATYRRRDADKRRRDAKKASKLAKVDADRQAFLAAHPELAELADLPEDANMILIDLADYLGRKGKLTDPQVALAARILRERDERAARLAADRAAAQPAPTGRVQVEGEIVSVKLVETWNTYHGERTWKMTVRADGGFRVFCTVPRDLLPDVTTVDYDQDVKALRGQRVTLTVTLEASADDETFAFGKRPSKARVLAAA